MTGISRQEKIRINQDILRKQKLKRENKVVVKERKQSFIFNLVLVSLAILVGFYIIYEGYLFIKSSLLSIKEINNFDNTVTQIPQLVNNVRFSYINKKGSVFDKADKLIASKVFSKPAIHDGKIINAYGGEIVVKRSHDIKNNLSSSSYPTFKISYQGLSKEACVKLATMDWSNNSTGLLAVAIGSVDEHGNDKALNDVDFNAENRIQKIKDDKGHVVIIKPKLKYKFNVAKPHATFNSIPFSVEDAELECSCNTKDNCSFAWHYSVFNIKRH